HRSSLCPYATLFRSGLGTEQDRVPFFQAQPLCILPGDEDLVAPGARQGIAFPPHDAVELFAAPRAEDEAAFREGVLRQSGDVEAGPAVRRVEFVAFAEPGTSPLEVVPLFLEVLNAVVGRNDPA